MIETLIGIYMIAWFGVFWLLIPRASPFRFWAFIPAFICSIAVPGIVWESYFTSKSFTAFVVVVAIGGTLPFALLTCLLIRRFRMRKACSNCRQ